MGKLFAGAIILVGGMAIGYVVALSEHTDTSLPTTAKKVAATKKAPTKAASTRKR